MNNYLNYNKNNVSEREIFKLYNNNGYNLYNFKQAVNCIQFNLH